MAPRLSGLSGITGYQVFIDENSQATAEERLGGTADPKHSERGETARPYSWESQMTPGGSHGPYGPENQLLGDEDWYWQPGGNEYDDPDMDHTPMTRAAPFPKGILSGPIPGENPDAVAAQRIKSMAIHSVNTGASKRFQHSSLEPDYGQWQDLWAVDPGGTDVQELGRQNKSAGFMFGTTDRVQSFARQNGYGFDSKHMHRRWAVAPIEGNNYWMRPGGRIMRKSIAGPARPAIGRDSPFAGDDLGQTFAIGGAMLLDAPTEYVAPPQPNLAAPPQNATYDSVVEWW